LLTALEAQDFEKDFASPAVAFGGFLFCVYVYFAFEKGALQIEDLDF
jgi:hypothetical protein